MIEAGKIRNFVLIILITFGMVGSLELAVRFYIYIKYGVPGKSYGTFEGHPVLRGQLRPNSYSFTREFNDHAFQTSENVDFADTVTRIITYGGSTTFSYNLAMPDTWPLRLQEQLRDSGRPVQVLNAGVVMWSSGHILIKAREQISLIKPKIVIVYSGINEVFNRDFLALEGVALPDPGSNSDAVPIARSLTQASWLFQNLVLFKIARGVSDQIKSRFTPEDDRVTSPYAPLPSAQREQLTDPTVFANYVRNLRRLNDVIRANGATMVFVVQARAWNGPVVSEPTAYSRRAASVVRDMGAMVIDPQADLATGDLPLGQMFSSSGVHYSAEGSRRFAALLAERLKPLIAEN